ncbi:MAG TPA: pyridoxine 5'-phosphate synthase [Nevskiaceae bacterium]|nr:pyridoxine 5'-phosphate synthase [Nevskiaceae bacterium]
MAPIRLGVNVDHVATVRQARGTSYPDPVDAAVLAIEAGADSITMHLREDRRHIQDRDVREFAARSRAPLNLEMAVTDEMVALACEVKPRFACLVPERRAELTTEGGLHVAKQPRRIANACAKLRHAGIDAALFVDPEVKSLDAILETQAPHIEIHTGRYCDLTDAAERARELARITEFAKAAAGAGLEVHAGHGLTVDNVGPIAAIPEIVELNIGHSLVARALFVGMGEAVREMRGAMTKARKS